MMMFDPLYMIIMAVGGVLMFLPQMWVKNVVKKFSDVPHARGLTGAEIAEMILRENRVHDVQVEMTPGELSDHYDPGAKKVRLSEANYHGRTVCAAAIAAHEVGHAMQHASGYVPVVIRGSLVPAVNLGGRLGPLLLMASFMLGAFSGGMPEWAWMIGWMGVAMFGASVVFHLVTLPVEIDASMRAIRVLSGNHYLNSQELPGAKKVLTAAAFTYIATAMYSLIQLAYWIFRLTNSRR